MSSGRKKAYPVAICLACTFLLIMGVLWIVLPFALGLTPVSCEGDGWREIFVVKSKDWWVRK